MQNNMHERRTRHFSERESDLVIILVWKVYSNFEKIDLFRHTLPDSGYLGRV